MAKTLLIVRNPDADLHNPYHFDTLARYREDVQVMMHAGGREGLGRNVVPVEGTARDSMAAEMGWASESEEEEETVEEEIETRVGCQGVHLQHV